MRRIYIHEQPGWLHFRWQQRGMVDQLAAVRHRQGWLLGRMEAPGFDLRREALLDTLTEDVVTSSAIEGENRHGSSPLLDRPSSTHGYRRTESRRPQCRRHRRADVGRNGALCPAAYSGAPVRLARRPVSYRTERPEADHGGWLARRQLRSHAGRLRPHWPGAGALRGSGSNEARPRDTSLLGVVQRTCRYRRGAQGWAGSPLVCYRPPLRRR